MEHTREQKIVMKLNSKRTGNSRTQEGVLLCLTSTRLLSEGGGGVKETHNTPERNTQLT